MATTQSVDNLTRLAERAAAETKLADTSLFALADATVAEQTEWDAVRDDERAYWAESDEIAKTPGVTGAQIVSEDRGE